MTSASPLGKRTTEAIALELRLSTAAVRCNSDAVCREPGHGEVFCSTIRTAMPAGNAPLAPKGIKRTLNLVEAAALLAAEARRECELLMPAAFRIADS